VPRAAYDANASAAVAAALAAVPPWRRRQMRERMEALRPHLLWTVPHSDKAPLMLQAPPHSYMFHAHTCMFV
jgi:hypothetical protein